MVGGKITIKIVEIAVVVIVVVCVVGVVGIIGCDIWNVQAVCISIPWKEDIKLYKQRKCLLTEYKLGNESEDKDMGNKEEMR